MERNQKKIEITQRKKMKEAYFIGIDIGTQGARAVIMDTAGNQIAAQNVAFNLNEHSREEQSPDEWWNACCLILPQIITEARRSISVEKIKTIAVTSTSGTIIPIGFDKNPIHPAIMYSDSRSVKEAAFCKEIAGNVLKEGFTSFSTSCGLPKMLWFLNQYPQKITDIYKFIHAADFITGRLCGEYNVTDYTNAMKSGFNIHTYEWPSYIFEKAGIRREWVQEVRKSGEAVKLLRPELAALWGLPDAIIVTTGVTDGCASQIASGAINPGQWNTTIGTTLVIKGVTKREIIDPQGVIYNHRHPAGYWMPGGASNTGADWVNILFSNMDLPTLTKAAEDNLPSKSLAWPLIQKGERFPFKAPDARGFWPEGDIVDKFTSCMEGVAFIERMAYERISELSGEKIEKIFSAGGGSNNDTWLRIRSNVMGIPVCKMKNVSGAAGAAILGASNRYFANLQVAAGELVKPDSVVCPEAGLTKLYNEKYLLFLEELRSRKVIK